MLYSSAKGIIMFGHKKMKNRILIIAVLLWIYSEWPRCGTFKKKTLKLFLTGAEVDYTIIR